ncbi:MAG: biotin--[Lachnospiraceae bacterium]|nr:biotin--[acetyl-CoA-carboxylase] ligase [Lachnospiraceae bacterium]
MNTALQKEIIEQYLPGLEVRVFETIDSTNTEARRIAGKEGIKPVLIAASSQSAGRGRMGRSFYSPENTGLYMTLLYPCKDARNLLSVTSKTAVAVLKGIEAVKPDIHPEIKWVNDLYLNGRKICGILAESVLDPEEQTVKGVIVGIGINLSTEDFPEDIRETAGSLGDASIDRNRLASSVTGFLLEELENLEDRSYLELYRERSCVIGKEIVFIEDGLKKNACAESINDDAGLVVRLENGDLVTLSSGEISVRVRKR